VFLCIYLLVFIPLLLYFLRFTKTSTNRMTKDETDESG
jgi:hypothetical protein